MGKLKMGDYRGGRGGGRGRGRGGRKFYDDDKEAQAMITTKLFIGNLSDEITEDDLRGAFGKYGDVAECSLINNFAFIHYKDPVEADLAVEHLNQTELCGSYIRVQKSTSNVHKTANERGGGGGRRFTDRGGRGGGRGGYRDDYRRPDPYARDYPPRDGYRDPYGPPADPYGASAALHSRLRYLEDLLERRLPPAPADPYARDPYGAPPRPDPYARPPADYYDRRRPGGDADGMGNGIYDRGPERKNGFDPERGPAPARAPDMGADYLSDAPPPRSYAP